MSPVGNPGQIGIYRQVPADEPVRRWVSHSTSRIVGLRVRAVATWCSRAGRGDDDQLAPDVAQHRLSDVVNPTGGEVLPIPGATAAVLPGRAAAARAGCS